MYYCRYYCYYYYHRCNDSCSLLLAPPTLAHPCRRCFGSLLFTEKQVPGARRRGLALRAKVFLRTEGQTAGGMLPEQARYGGAAQVAAVKPATCAEPSPSSAYLSKAAGVHRTFVRVTGCGESLQARGRRKLELNLGPG